MLTYIEDRYVNATWRMGTGVPAKARTPVQGDVGTFGPVRDTGEASFTTPESPKYDAEERPPPLQDRGSRVSTSRG